MACIRSIKNMDHFPLSKLISPAIDLAEKGFILSKFQANTLIKIEINFQKILKQRKFL